MVSILFLKSRLYFNKYNNEISSIKRINNSLNL